VPLPPSQARPEIEKLVEQLKAEQAKGSASAVSEYQARIAAVWQKHGAHPVKSMVPMFLQAPLFMGFFLSLRALATAKVGCQAHAAAVASVLRRGNASVPSMTNRS
jgi:membrane protein insertase Oxa1/YidC/SpoIIIJ